MIEFIEGLITGTLVGMFAMAILAIGAYERGAQDAIETLARRRKAR